VKYERPAGGTPDFAILSCLTPVAQATTAGKSILISILVLVAAWLGVPIPADWRGGGVGANKTTAKIPGPLKIYFIEEFGTMVETKMFAKIT
jgi:hypothetical protein